MKDNKGDCSFLLFRGDINGYYPCWVRRKIYPDAEPREECIAFSVYIKSGDFSGRGTFVYTVNEFRELISQLKLIYITLDGEVRIAYADSDDYVHIICNSYGHIKVEAQLGGSWRDNWVKLLLNTDQTVLNEVIQQCNSILKK